MDVYVDIDPEANFETTPLSSFKTSTLTKMTYKDFLDKSGQSSMSLVMKEKNLLLRVKAGIKEPSFLEELAEPMSVTMI